jgi:hypothetical protein
MASPYSTGRRGVAYGGAISRAKSIKGSDDFLKLSKRLKAAGETELRKELNKVMRDTAKPLIPKVREAARRDLPTHGGLNERIARKPYRVQVRTGAKTAGVRIVGTKVDPRINQGRVFHPVFGRPGSGVVQQIPTADGYFDDTLRESAPQIRADIIKALGDFTKKITRPL